MLVLDRYPGQSIRIGNDITIKVLGHNKRPTRIAMAFG